MTIRPLRLCVAHQQRLNLVIARRQLSEVERIAVAFRADDSGFPRLQILDIDAEGWRTVEPERQPWLGGGFLRRDNDHPAGDRGLFGRGERHREPDFRGRG
jgi:hypothetical protein